MNHISEGNWHRILKILNREKTIAIVEKGQRHTTDYMYHIMFLVLKIRQKESTLTQIFNRNVHENVKQRTFYESQKTNLLFSLTLRQIDRSI